MHSPIFFLLLIITFTNLPTSLCANDPQYTYCTEQFTCGTIRGLKYPFWGVNRGELCGRPEFKLDCKNNISRITIMSQEFIVLRADSQSLTVARSDYWHETCPARFLNTTINSTLFSYAPELRNLSLYYNCTFYLDPDIGFSSQHRCIINKTDINLFYATIDLNLDPTRVACSSTVRVPVFERGAQNLETNRTNLEDVLDEGFGLRLNVNSSECRVCVDSGGECGFDRTENRFTCFCRDRPNSIACSTRSDRRGSGNQLDVVLPVVGAILAGIGMAWLFFFCRQRRRRRAAAQTALTAKSESKELTVSLSSKDISSSTTSTKFTRSIPSYPSTNEFGKSSTYFGVQVFSYAELEEATDNFDSSRELGDGGFGTVYYAKLVDGREVAVKRLYENNFKRVEQFMNEVEILTRLHHQYLVKLYGCTSKRSRELLLVYEYIPNGTVADHLHGKQSNSGLLSWPVRLNIAIETADALAYLHRSEIIHRDVKTNNILLDNEFRVKVADFGLSRLFPTDQTHVSTAPQGTPGYVDPEYYQCYQLTEKSDVYSFGVVLVELISSLQAVDTNRHRHDINLSNMAVNKIQNHELDGFVDPGLGFKTDVSVKRMMTLVAELAFRCLQQDKDVRPSMKEVLDSLREIQKEELDYQKAEVVDIVVDDTLPLKSNTSPDMPDSFVTENWVSSSAPNSIG